MTNHSLDNPNPKKNESYLEQFKESLHRLLSHQASGNLGLFEYSEPNKFNDSRINGSQLWQEFAQLPSYYIHTSERQMLPNVASTLQKYTTPEDILIFLGVGDGIKEIELIGYMEKINSLFLYDMSLPLLEEVAQKCRNLFPTKKVQTVLGDYCHREIPTPFTSNNIACEFGGTMANQQTSLPLRFPIEKFVNHLKLLLRFSGEKGYCIVSYDCNQDEKSLHACYQGGDSFGLNVLYQIPQIDPHFDPEAFLYRPRWIPECHLYAHILVSTQQQTLHMKGQTYIIEKGQELFTNHSFKPPRALFHQIAKTAGFQIEDEIIDPQGRVVFNIMRNNSRT